jgi:hypothetical protein
LPEQLGLGIEVQRQYHVQAFRGGNENRDTARRYQRFIQFYDRHQSERHGRGLTYTPAELEAATLVVKDSDSSSPQLIPLRGTGIAK